MSVLSKITFEDLDAASCSEPLKYQIADLIAERDQLREQLNKVVWGPQGESDSGFYHAMPVERLTEIHNKIDQLRIELAETKALCDRYREALKKECLAKLDPACRCDVCEFLISVGEKKALLSWCNKALAGESKEG